MVKKLPEEVQKFIDRYFALDVAGKKVICPYFMNIGGIFKDSVMAGKGDPLEIEAKAADIFSHISLVDKSEEFIRTEMLDHGLGVDCSGLVYQILNKWLRDVANKGEFKDYLPKQKTFNPRKMVSRLLKPQSSVNADMLTSEPISTKVEIKDIQPGDMIRTRGGKHILFITEVEYNADKTPKTLTFVNSTTYYIRNGMRYGKIHLNHELNLSTSTWDDNDPGEATNFAYKGYRELMDNNGVFRPNLPIYQ
jgi:hypothetical protein